MALLSVFAAVVDVGWRLVGGEARLRLGNPSLGGWRGATANDEGLRGPRQGTQLNNLSAEKCPKITGFHMENTSFKLSTVF